MKLNPGVRLAAAAVIVAAIEIGFHWLVGRGDNPGLLGVYLSRDSGGKAFFAGTVDNTIPALVLGCVNGWVGFPRWSVRKLIVTTAAIALFVAALVPVYRMLIGPSFASVWGRPNTAAKNAAYHLYDFMTAFLTAGPFTYGAYVFRRDWNKRGS